MDSVTTYFDFWLDNCCRFHLECPYHVRKHTHPSDHLQNKTLTLHSQLRSGRTGTLMATPLSFWCLYDLMRRNNKCFVCKIIFSSLAHTHKKSSFTCYRETRKHILLCPDFPMVENLLSVTPETPSITTLRIICFSVLNNSHFIIYLRLRS